MQNSVAFSFGTTRISRFYFRWQNVRTLSKRNSHRDTIAPMAKDSKTTLINIIVRGQLTAAVQDKIVASVRQSLVNELAASGSTKHGIHLGGTTKGKDGELTISLSVGPGTVM